MLRASEVPGGTGVCVGLRGAAVISTRRADLSVCWPLPSLPSVLCLPPQPRGATSYAPPPQVFVLALTFLVLFLGNFLTTLKVVHTKLQQNRSKAKKP